MSEQNELKNDWPADAEDDDLVHLAEQLRDVAAPLSAEALARVEEQMQAALGAAARRARWRRAALGWSVAAGIVVAVGGYAYFHRDADPRAAPVVVRKAQPPALIEVDDRIAVAVGETTSRKTNEKPLVALDEYRSLFTD